jgi:hypothetical protein
VARTGWDRDAAAVEGEVMLNRTAMRGLAGITAGISALLYYLIGFGVLDIGEAASGEDPGLLGFGLSAGTVFLLAGVLVLFVQRRWLVALIGLMDAAVIAGYFVMADIRVPSYEVWGLSIKAVQVVLLLAIGFLLIGGERVREGRPA